MRNNEHIVRLPILPKPSLMILLSQLVNQLIQSLGDILRALATLTPIAPDIPVLIQPALFAQLPHLSTLDALVVAVVPLAHVLSDLDGRVGARVQRVGGFLV